MMNVDIEFYFDAIFKPKRAKVNRKIRAKSITSEDIEEVDGVLFAKVSNSQNMAPYWWSRFCPEQLQEVNVWDVEGKLYVEQAEVDGIIEYMRSRNSFFNGSKFVGDKLVSFSPLAADAIGAAYTSQEIIDNNPGLQLYDEGNLKVKERILKERVSLLRVINGKVCAPITEPVIVVSNINKKGGEFIAEAFVSEIGHVGGIDIEIRDAWDQHSSKIFRLDQVSEAKSYIENLSAYGSVENFPNIRLGEAYKSDLNQGARSCYEAGSQCGTMMNMYDWLDKDVVEAMLDILEEIEKLPENESGDRLPEMLSVMSECLDRYKHRLIVSDHIMKNREFSARTSKYEVEKKVFLLKVAVDTALENYWAMPKEIRESQSFDVGKIQKVDDLGVVCTAERLVSDAALARCMSLLDQEMSGLNLKDYNCVCVSKLQKIALLIENNGDYIVINKKTDRLDSEMKELGEKMLEQINFEKSFEMPII